MKTYHIKAETADAIRAAAPKLGLAFNGRPEIVAPGVEAVHLPDLVSVALDMRAKQWRKGLDSAVLRIIREATA